MQWKQLSSCHVQERQRIPICHYPDRHPINQDPQKVKVHVVINIIYFSVDIVMGTTGATNALSFQPPKTEEIRSETVVTYV